MFICHGQGPLGSNQRNFHTRLELTGAVISVKLSHVIWDELDLTLNKVIYWTDSTSVLKCINNETKRFHTFESNRLTIKHDGSTPQQWRYVNREDNPAYDGSKGLKLDVLIKNHQWLTGPKFLSEEEECWLAMFEIPTLKDDDPEVRKDHHPFELWCQKWDFTVEGTRYSLGVHYRHLRRKQRN